MKTRVLNRIIPLVLIAFFNVFSGYSHTIEPVLYGLDSHNTEYLHKSKNTQAIFFEEVQGTYSFFETKRNSFYGSGLQEKYFAKLSDFHQHSEKCSNSQYLQDIRKLLEHQVFPFHFFW